MSIITNNLNLPQPLVDAVARDPYEAPNCDISVTALLKPARAVALEKLHAHELTEDASDRLWALLGQIGHLILERAATRSIIERRFYTTVDGWSISGRVDIILPTAQLIDYKVTSAFTVKDGLKPEWTQQINLLAMLAHHNGQAIEGGQIVCIFRDWSKWEAKRDSSYPQKQVQVFDVPIWPDDQTMAFARDRVAAHQRAQAGDLPECTSEERWERAPKFAVMKKDRKIAVKLHLSRENAQEYLNSIDNGKGVHYIEERPGLQVRCEAYCAALPFCSFAKSLGVGGNE